MLGTCAEPDTSLRVEDHVIHVRAPELGTGVVKEVDENGLSVMVLWGPPTEGGTYEASDLSFHWVNKVRLVEEADLS